MFESVYFNESIKNSNEKIEVIIRPFTVNGKFTSEVCGPEDKNSSSIISLYFSLARLLSNKLVRLGIDDIEVGVQSIPNTRLCNIIFYTDILWKTSEYDKIITYLWKIINNEIKPQDILYIFSIDVSAIVCNVSFNQINKEFENVI